MTDTATRSTSDREQAPAPSQALPTFRDASWVFYLGRALCRLFASTLFFFKAYDTRNVPTRGGVLVVANHQSYLDPAMFAILLRRPASFLAKSGLFENKIFGGLIRRCNAFPVRQGEGDVGAIKETIKRLREGHILTMFPEGGRCATGEIEPLLPGVALIVRRAGENVQVVPAAVDGAFEAWPRHHKLPTLFRPVHIKYGKPLRLSHLPKEEIMEIIDREIRRLHAELRATIHPDKR